MREKKKLLLSAAVLAVNLLLVWMCVELYRSKYGLTVTSYQISSEKIQEPFRIVQLSDLHNSSFGENNEKLIEQIINLSPDYICMTGDMFNATQESLKVISNLVSRLSEQFPVYYSYGNHEEQYPTHFSRDWEDELRKAGAVLLDYEYLDIASKNLRLGGIYGYCLPEKYLETEEAREKECRFLKKFQNTDAYTILLCHMPVCFLMNGALEEWNMDNVLAGHTHGGQIRLPLIGGLYAPDQGWFPGRVWGRFDAQEQNHTLIVSRGLGTSFHIPRLFNVPEIVVIDYTPEDKR